MYTAPPSLEAVLSVKIQSSMRLFLSTPARLTAPPTLALFAVKLDPVIVAEEPEPAFVKNNINVYRKLTIAHGCIQIMLNHYKKEMELVSASHWRKNCGIKTGRGITRAMLKPQDIAKAKELYPDYAAEIGNSDDKADAVLVGHSWFVENNKSYNWE